MTTTTPRPGIIETAILDAAAQPLTRDQVDRIIGAVRRGGAGLLEVCEILDPARQRHDVHVVWLRALAVHRTVRGYMDH